MRVSSAVQRRFESRTAGNPIIHNCSESPRKNPSPKRERTDTCTFQNRDTLRKSDRNEARIDAMATPLTEVEKLNQVGFTTIGLPDLHLRS